VRFIISGASPQIRRTLINHGVKRPLVTYAASIRDARAQLNGKQDSRRRLLHEHGAATFLRRCGRENVLLRSIEGAEA